MRKYLETFVVTLVCFSSVTVTICALVWLMSQQPFARKSDLQPLAHKSEIAEVKATAVTALKNTHTEQAIQDKSSAEVKAELKKAIEKLQADDKEIALLKKRLGELDGSAFSRRHGKGATQQLQDQ